MVKRIVVVEHLGGNRARWRCAAGHEWEGELIPSRVPVSPARPKGRTRANVALRGVGEAGFAHMASWWSEAKGGVTGECPQCR